jgi:hypothetical protein
MYGNYLVLCGMVWSQFGAQEAGRELIRALASSDPDVRVLARTLLEQSHGGSKELIGEALAEEEISASMASLCGFDKGQEPGVERLGGTAWLRTASA